MKKLLSILGAIGLTATSTTTLINCEKPNKNKNGEDNKREPNKPQQPPENSSGKLIEDKFKNFGELKPNNKGYILLLKNYVSNNGNIIKIYLIMNPRDIEFEPKTTLEAVYRGDGINEPETPKINKNGKIIDGKEQKD